MKNDRRFDSVGYDDFRAMSCDKSMSRHEKIGFPDSYREGKTRMIIRDIAGKIPALNKRGTTIADIGCGCGDLILEMAAHCAQKRQRLILADSPEMLSQIPDMPHLVKIGGRFPDETAANMPAASCDAVIAYSVLHYVFAESCVFYFLDAALAMLAPGGRLLLGDIPNSSMRRRFLSSATGAAFHKKFTGKDECPQIHPYAVERKTMDDSVVLGLLSRGRAAGFDAYVVPQSPNLPMANRREDLLFSRP